MKSNAAGQLLGYSLQFPRALFHLLTCSPDDIVSIEVIGDVATQKHDNSLITEEDKSSVVGNPITNKSKDLWKTFYNWTKAVNDSEIDVHNTKFILYCNKSGQHGVVDEFSSVINKDTALAAIEYAKSKLSDINKDHGIWKFYDYVINNNENILLNIIQRFELQIGEGASYDGLREELKKKHIVVSQIEFVLECLSGWLQKDILVKIASNNKAVVSWKEFDKQFQVLFDRSRKRELIDFTLHSMPEAGDINNQLKIRPTYIKQLDIIGMDDDDVMRAVSDYMRANINRGRWIEEAIIDEDIANDFESKLNTFWTNNIRRIKIVHSDLSDQNQGKLLYSECMVKNELIRDMAPPDSTVSGTYHELADSPVLGWHPDWETNIKK